MVIVLISPLLNECGSAVGDSLKDALASFHSLKWQQGWNADARVLEEYGEWAVYKCADDSRYGLIYCGNFKDLISSLCPERLPQKKIDNEENNL